METTFYNVFRTTIRILLNDYINSEKRKEIQEESNQRFLLYDEIGELKQASFDINEMKDGIDYVSITRHIGLVNITLEEFVENIKDINGERYIV